MARKKKGVDLGKGFKRIYFVISGVWVAIMFFFYFSEFAACEIHKMDAFMCINFNPTTHWFSFLVVGGIVVPIYYFILWINDGFKK